MFHGIRGGRGALRRALDDERGFTLIELLIVVVIIGVLAAIAVPAYLGQQKDAEDKAAQAQLRSAATAQQIFHARDGGYADMEAELEGAGFRQGGQEVNIESATGNAYCMQAAGGSGTFKMTHLSGKPSTGPC